MKREKERERERKRERREERGGRSLQYLLVIFSLTIMLFKAHMR